MTSMSPGWRENGRKRLRKSAPIDPDDGRL
jgi:hypothetical protein